jgi:hypothetical protein
MLEVDAPDFVDVTLMRQQAPARAPRQPAGGQAGELGLAADRTQSRARVRHRGAVAALASGERLREARLASTEAVLPARVDAGIVEVVVPRLEDHEVVVFEARMKAGREASMKKAVVMTLTLHSGTGPGAAFSDAAYPTKPVRLIVRSRPAGLPTSWRGSSPRHWAPPSASR